MRFSYIVRWTPLSRCKYFVINKRYGMEIRNESKIEIIKLFMIVFTIIISLIILSKTFLERNNCGAKSERQIFKRRHCLNWKFIIYGSEI